MDEIMVMFRQTIFYSKLGDFPMASILRWFQLLWMRIQRMLGLEIAPPVVGRFSPKTSFYVTAVYPGVMTEVVPIPTTSEGLEVLAKNSRIVLKWFGVSLPKGMMVEIDGVEKIKGVTAPFTNSPEITAPFISYWFTIKGVNALDGGIAQGYSEHIADGTAVCVFYET